MAKIPTVEIIEGPKYARDDEGWEHYSYKLRIRFGRRSMTSLWQQGVGVMSDPDIHDVMSAMLSDTSGIFEGQTFEGWAEEYGYDVDSRRAEATYRAVERQTNNLRRLLGPDLLESLVSVENYDDATYGSEEMFRAAWDRASRATR